MLRFRDTVLKTRGVIGSESGLNANGSIFALSFVEFGKKSSNLYRWRSTSSPSENGPSYMHHPGSTPLIEQTLGQLVDQAANRYPDRNCVISVHQNVRLTFSEVRKRADKIAAGLKKIGLNKGDRVGIWSPNTVEWYIACLASLRAGFQVVGMNPADQLMELEYAIQKVRIKAVVALDTFKTQNYPEMLLNAQSRCPSLEHIIITHDKNISGTRRFVDIESLPSPIEVEAIGAEQSEINPKSTAAIVFTSGTTGKPKAAQVSHISYLNNSRQGSQRLGLGIESAICPGVPYFHAFGMVMSILSPLHSGATVVLADFSFNAEKTINAVVKEKCNGLYGTPTMWVDLVNKQQEVKAPLGKIRFGLTGGSPASPDLFQRIRSTLGVEEMQSIFGQSETTAVAFQGFVGHTSKELAETTVGHLSDHTEAQVVDENGVPVPFGTPGELWVRGYHNMIGYWEDEANTKKTLTDDGWLKTGDQFVLRPDGYGKVIGRLKDMLIRGGENIFPKEIEDILEAHPAVIEAHAFGVHDDRLGEEICACIRLRKGSDLTSEDVRGYFKGKVAHFKIPRYIHFTEEFPKTASGKIKKYLLRDMLEAEGIVPRRPSVNQ